MYTGYYGMILSTYMYSDLLEDNTMDDRMNKMEGPVSSFMHKIETIFTSRESQEAADKKKDDKM